MIVPEFKLRQSDGYVEVFIRVPYIKVTSCEFYIQANTFKFYLKPYLLSLTFQQSLKEVEEPHKAVYYHDKYVLEVHLEKKNHGERFEDLDMLANILNNKKQKKKGNNVVVEVVGEQSKVLVQEGKAASNSYHYGFSLNYSNVMDNLQEQTAELFEFDPKCTPLSQRFDMSRSIIIKNFDYDSYLFDKYENEEQIVSLIDDKQYLEHLSQKFEGSNNVEINSTEFKLKTNTSKQVMISAQTQKNIFREIGTICFSYIYQLICMRGEMSEQSAKTINRTSLILSSNSYYYDMDIKSILADCYRRCLTYSLYKSLKICRLSLQCLKNCCSIKHFIAIFQHVRQILQKNQPRYLLNRLFIHDYLIYLYSTKEETSELQIFINDISGIFLQQTDLQLAIKEYEEACNEDSQQDQPDSQQEQHEKTKEQREKTLLIQEFQKMDTLD